MVKARYEKRAVVHYTARLDDGTILDNSFGGNPLEFTFGRCEVIPHFEEAVRGMSPGEIRRIRISAEQLFIGALDFMAVRSEESSLGCSGEIQIDRPLRSGAEASLELISDQTDIPNGEKGIVPDHPLAGKDIIFDVHLLAVL